jgi:hypothetical protein
MALKWVRFFRNSLEINEKMGSFCQKGLWVPPLRAADFVRAAADLHRRTDCHALLDSHSTRALLLTARNEHHSVAFFNNHCKHGAFPAIRGFGAPTLVGFACGAPLPIEIEECDSIFVRAKPVWRPALRRRFSGPRLSPAAVPQRREFRTRQELFHRITKLCFSCELASPERGGPIIDDMGIGG